MKFRLSIALSCVLLLCSASAEETLSRDGDFDAIGAFTIELRPVGKTSAPINRELSKTVKKWMARASQDDFSALEEYLKNNPKSPWAAAIALNLAESAYRTGWFSKSLSAYARAWELTRNEKSESGMTLGDAALAGKMGLLARVGRLSELEALANETESRPRVGASGELIGQARNGLEEMRTLPGKSFKCGPEALGKIMRASGTMTPDAFQKIFEKQSPNTGFNLYQVWEFSKSLGMKMQMAFRPAGSEVVVPSVVHWKLDHYGAITGSDAGKFHLEDPTFVQDFWVTKAAIDAEASGYVLVPEGPVPAGWRKVERAEAEKVWGKGNSAPSDTNAVGSGDAASHFKLRLLMTSATQGCEKPWICPGMPVAGAHLMLVSLSIVDTPLVYLPGRGAGGAFTIFYSERTTADASNPPLPNFGANWTSNWLGFVRYNPNAPSASASVSERGGGVTPYGGFSSTSNSSTLGWLSPTVLKRNAATGSTTFERTFPDGSREVYLEDDGVPVTPGTTVKRVFLSQIIDAQGNVISLTYDPATTTRMPRLKQITDASGGKLSIRYVPQNSPSDPAPPADSYKIAGVDYLGTGTTPLSTAGFTYDAQGRLSGVTDTMGITSTFGYKGTTTFIESMTTPYGTSTFRVEDRGSGIRQLTLTDPMGNSERIENVSSGTNQSVPADEVPNFTTTPFIYFNQWMASRNTFYWDKKAFAEAKDDYSRARVYHWLHSSANIYVTDRVLESYKEPFSSRVWFNYVGTELDVVAPGAVAAKNALPTKIARNVDMPDGSIKTQVFQRKYNALGNLTESIDPLGRKTVFTYAPNGIDLVEVSQVGSGGPQRLLSATYNSKHLPLTVTDAAGQTTTYSYFPDGQIETITNPLGAVTTFTYHPSGQLWTVDGPLPGTEDKSTFTYDTLGNLATATDGEGYALAYTHDALLRLKKIEFPDATTIEKEYFRLDVKNIKDRAGRVTSFTYNGIRQLTTQRDPLDRITAFDWCKCGDLKSLTDPMGRTTLWKHDVQGRITAKVYPDGKQDLFTFDRSSRPRTSTDALNQVTTTKYNLDDTPASVAFTSAINPTPNLSFTWDTVFPRPLSVSDGTGTTNYTYNPISSTPTLGAGRIATIDGPLANDTIAYSYDELGRAVTTSINGSSNTQTLTFSTVGRLTRVTNALGQFDFNYVGQTHRLSTITAPNGVITSLAYFPNVGDRRLQTLTHGTSASGTLSSFGYEYDVVGNITNWTQNQASNTVTPAMGWNIQYDAVDQLTGISAPGLPSARRAFRYDAAGNRLTTEEGDSVRQATFNKLNQLTTLGAGGTIEVRGTIDEPANVTVQGQPARMLNETNFVSTATVSAGTNAIPVIATDGSGNSRTNVYQVVVPPAAERAFTYDANGNLLSDGNRTYEWDALNRLVKVTQANDVYEYAYNAFSQRVSEKKNGLVTKRWVWAGGNQPAEERAADNTVVKRFFAQGEQVGPTLSYYTKDHLGSIRQVTDATGAVVASYTYDAWGKRTLTAGTDLATFGFTGHYQNNDLGLVTTLYRFYDPETGRWLSRDPIGETGGINLYGYVANNPVNLWDPLGLEVAANYSISTGALTAIDSGRRVSMTGWAGSGTNIFSEAGRKLGPLPPGQYNIYERPGGMFGQPAYILDPVDSRLGNDSWDNGLGRGAFRFHLGFPNLPRNGSDGCIVMDGSTLSNLNDLLQQTDKGPLQTIRSPNRNREPDVWPNLPRLGTLTVTK